MYSDVSMLNGWYQQPVLFHGLLYSWYTFIEEGLWDGM